MSVFHRIAGRLRREAPPPAALGWLAPGDRLLAWATTPDRGVVVATRNCLRLPDGRQLAWHLIDKAVWRDSVLTLTEAVDIGPGVAENLPPVVVPLADPRDLPVVVRTRVTRSVAYTAHHRLPGGGGVRVVARRVVGQDGLTWSVRYDGAGDRHDPGAEAAAEQLLSAARTSMTPSE